MLNNNNNKRIIIKEILVSHFLPAFCKLVKAVNIIFKQNLLIASGTQRCPAYVNKEVLEQMNPIFFLAGPPQLFCSMQNLKVTS